jgi:hypothetical protein
MPCDEEVPMMLASCGRCCRRRRPRCRTADNHAGIVVRQGREPTSAKSFERLAPDAIVYKLSQGEHICEVVERLSLRWQSPHRSHDGGGVAGSCLSLDVSERSFPQETSGERSWAYSCSFGARHLCLVQEVGLPC